MTATEMLEVCAILIDEGVMTGYVKEPTRRPTHGNCCTCQDCGMSHDDCVCQHNRILAKLEAMVETQVEVVVSSSSTN